MQIRLREAHHRKFQRVPAERDCARDEPGENDECCCDHAQHQRRCQLRSQQAAAGNGPGQECAEVAPVRFGSDDVTCEECDHNDEQEPTHELQRGDPEVRAGLGGEIGERIVGVAEILGSLGGFDFSARVMIKGINTMTPRAT